MRQHVQRLPNETNAIIIIIYNVHSFENEEQHISICHQMNFADVLYFASAKNEINKIVIQILLYFHFRL